MTARPRMHPLTLTVVPLISIAFGAGAQTHLPTVEVTSSKIERELDRSSSTVSVISAADLRARGAKDLRTALALVAGVEASPGGDGGPAASVPALWGLREFDAFLLLVDGTPWGGAFVPALTSLDLNGVERIEVMRGGAPVSYGATSFVGVIHVIHYAPGKAPNRVAVGVGSRGSARAELSWSPDNEAAALQQSVIATLEKQELAPDRSGYDRAHLLYRAGTEVAGGQLQFNGDVSSLRQDPTSPTPREGPVLSARVPENANTNPSDAHMDEDRIALSASFVRDLALGQWNTSATYTHTRNDITRGFLREGFSDGSTINADGYRQDREIDDFYFDSHIRTEASDRAVVLWGFDYLYGNGEQESDNFEYAVRPDGRNAPSSHSRPIDESTESEDRRHFAGAYVQFDYAINDNWSVDAGVRANFTRETREGGEIAADGSESEAGSEHANESRLTGALGTSYRFWQSGEDTLVAYANYKDTFKPAVVDFGPEAEAEILEPEEATSGEIGLRGRNADGRLEWDASVFYMEFSNLVVPQNVNGSPGLTNAGNQYFKGAELEAHYALADAWSLSGSWSHHQARFLDYVRLFGSTPTQLRGKQQELTPQHLSSLSLAYMPASGFEAYVTGAYVGDRYLNKRNTAPASPYTTVDAGVGYHSGHWEVRVDAFNLTDRRDPIAESELGDGQYYRMPARSEWVTLSYDFGT
jgi:outer membrane receptor protein involved in Fe transport